MFWWGGSVERMRYKPKVGEICVYSGRKSDIRGLLVICTEDKDIFSVWIKGYSTGTKHDRTVWSCSTTFLSPYQPTEPNWEI